MKLIETLDKLRKLILDRSPITEQMSIINSMVEQLESHDKQSADYANLQIEHAKLQNPKKKPTFAFIYFHNIII